jgi:hypothetical protein
MSDEQRLSGRVYGSDHDDPERGPQRGRTYAELVGGPLDGLLLDITGWSAEEFADGAALMSDRGYYGPGGRSLYGPRPDSPLRWEWEGDTA